MALLSWNRSIYCLILFWFKHFILHQYRETSTNCQQIRCSIILQGLPFLSIISISIIENHFIVFQNIIHDDLCTFACVSTNCRSILLVWLIFLLTCLLNAATASSSSTGENLLGSPDYIYVTQSSIEKVKVFYIDRPFLWAETSLRHFEWHKRIFPRNN